MTHSPLYGVGPCGSCAGPLGFKSSIYCLRGGEAIRSAGPRGLCAGAAVLIPFDAARVLDSVHQEAMWPNCVARVHAGGPRAS